MVRDKHYSINVHFVVSRLTQLGIELTIYHTQEEHAHRYTVNPVVIKLSLSYIRLMFFYLKH